MRTPRAVRAARGGAAATLATFVSLLSHVAAGGAMPGWLGVVAPWLFSVLVCLVIAGRRLSAVRLSAAVVVSQALFHVLFVLGSGSSTALVGHSHHGAVALAASGSGGTALDVALRGEPLMWAAHAIAAILTVVALYRGERMLVLLSYTARSVTAWLSRLVAVVLAPVVIRPRRVATTPRPSRVVLPAVPLSAVVRRGPPALV
ncbi:hypothetical protein GCM10025768_06640 [Microbacterium pseudoresistens]|uniref:Uncharacterized protein n=1 Tax=Microbacterium pseudoresistens TaxID=640634 RepID=A0A7Y9JMY0_9MICO|nr:hypothetical protein [Microbacterium pseudoresistens]NYD54501.1 hypothetical protein [Microbacterium pseudoresistens]